MKRFLLASTLLLGGIILSPAPPTLGGPTLSGTTSGGTGSGGGFAISNAVALTITKDTRFTNSTPYYADVSKTAIMNTIANATSTASVTFQVDPDADGDYDYNGKIAQLNGNATFADTLTVELGGIVPPGGAFRYLSTLVTSGTTADYTGSGQIVYYATNSSSGGSGDVTQAGLAAGAYSVAGNGGGMTNVTADGLSYVFYPENFGAVSTEHYDDSAAIQRCWDAAKTNVQFIVDGQNKVYWLNTNGVSLTATNLAHKGVLRNFRFMTTNHALPFMISNSANMTEIVDNYFGSPNHTNSSGTALKSRHLTDLWGAQDYTEMVWIHRNYFTNFAVMIDVMNQDNLLLEANRGWGFRSNGVRMVDCDQVKFDDNYFGFSGLPPHLRFPTNELARPDFFYGVGNTNWLYTSVAYYIEGGISTEMHRCATYGVGTPLIMDGTISATFINNDFEGAFNTNRGYMVITNGVSATIINPQFIANGGSEGPHIELNNANIRNCVIVNPPVWISQYPNIDPYGGLRSYPTIIGGPNAGILVLHSSYNPLTGGTTNSTSSGNVASLQSLNAWASEQRFNYKVAFQSALDLSFITGTDDGTSGDPGVGGNKTFYWAGLKADNNYFAMMFQQDFAGSSLRRVSWGWDGGVGRPAPTEWNWYAGPYGSAGTRQWQIDDGAFWNPDSPKNIGKSVSPVGNIYATNFTGRFNFPTNAATVTPNRTLIITNSNGETFKILAEKL